MRVYHFRRTHLQLGGLADDRQPAADDCPDPRQRQLQLFRFLRGRHEQSVLCPARFSRHGFQPDLRDRRARRMRLQLQLQQFQENLRVEYGNGKLDRARELFTAETQRRRASICHPERAPPVTGAPITRRFRA